jgi:hypothetical protein
MAFLAQTRGDAPLQAFSWDSSVKTSHSSHAIIASNYRQIKKSFTVKLLTIANYPQLLWMRGGFARRRYN